MKKIPLNLINLRYFFDAVKHGSISDSARVNFVSQSAISQGIAKLEKSIGFLLIDHQPKRFKITDEGQKLFENSKAIFQAIQQTEESLYHDIPRTIDLACTHSFAIALLPAHLRKARKQLPHVHFTCKLAHADEIMGMVAQGIVDLGILLDNSDLSAFDCEEIYQGQYRLYVSKTCKSVKDLSFLLDSEERTETNVLKKAYSKRYGKNLPVLMEISSWEVIANLTQEGLGVGFFPDYVATRRKAFLKPYPNKIVPHHPYRIFAIFSKNQKKPEHILSFLNLLRR